MTINKNPKNRATILTNFFNKQVPFHVYAGEWESNSISFAFEDARFDNAGVITFQADTCGLSVASDKPYLNLSTAEGEALTSVDDVNRYLGSIVGLFLKWYQFGYSAKPNEIPSYDAEYHTRSGYMNPGDFELKVKQFQADTVLKLAHPKKILVAGCSSGELVRQFKARGVEAFGFDIMPDLSNHVSSDVQNNIRTGSVQNVPFDLADGFDTYVALDVMEHVPEADVAQVIKEWLRLNVQQLVHMTNHNQFHFEGHVTLRPPHWWAKQWQSEYVEVDSFQLTHETLYDNDNDSNHVYRLFKRR